MICRILGHKWFRRMVGVTEDHPYFAEQFCLRCNVVK